jgi:hypothetical protein
MILIEKTANVLWETIWILFTNEINKGIQQSICKYDSIKSTTTGSYTP